MSATEHDNSDHRPRDMNRSQLADHHFSGMTESIISTINNTDPTLPIEDSLMIIGNSDANISGNNNNNNRTSTSNHSNDSSVHKVRRTTEPCYESYIEDSFVGHWETEEDDPVIENRPDSGDPGANSFEDDEPALHPSTIEFDFDSFGPESFIYTPQSSTRQQQLQEEPVKEVTESSTLKSATPLSNEASKKETDNQALENLQEVDNAATHTLTNQPHQSNCREPSPTDYLVSDNAQIDLTVIEPYKKVISHAGYCHYSDPSDPLPKPGEPAPAVIVFSACYLPDRSRRDYNYVMDHLFLYVLNSLHELIADDYVLIYLHNTQPSTFSNFSIRSSFASSANGTAVPPVRRDEGGHQNNLPTFTWMKRCYQMIDRRLRKNLKILYLVKPTFWLKTIVIMCKPFISAKFSKKLRFVDNLEELKKCLPVDKLTLPASADNL